MIFNKFGVKYLYRAPQICLLIGNYVAGAAFTPLLTLSLSLSPTSFDIVPDRVARSAIWKAHTTRPEDSFEHHGAQHPVLPT